MEKTIIVTGGTKGIGKAILRKFAAAGFTLITCSRNSNNLNELKEEFSADFPDVTLKTYQADLSDKKEVDQFVEKVKKDYPAPEVLVNNSGIFMPGAVHEEDEGVLEFQINNNLYSAYHVSRGFIGDMKKAGRGHLFNICSTASIIPYVNGGSYCISKFALYGMTKVLREEMKEHDVKVTAILPGATLTASWEGTDVPPERFMKAEDVAEAVWSAYNMSPNSVAEEILIRPQLGDL